LPPSSASSHTKCGRRWKPSGAGLAGPPAPPCRVLTIWGRTLAGRPLIVAVYHVSGFTWKIIGARDMTDKDLVEFTQWEETP
jgi:hypothetical protein